MTQTIAATVLLGPGAEHIVGDAIESAAPYVDAFLFIESGGGAAAEREARAVALREGKQVFNASIPWVGDYGQARNQALALARSYEFTWAMTLDPDERVRFGPYDEFRDILAQEDDIACWSSRDVDKRYIKPRVLRCSEPRLQWQGTCNELLDRVGPTGILPGGFRELPKSPEAERARCLRGISRMPAEIERDPKNAHWRRHYATCLLLEERYAEAAKEFKGAANVAVNVETRAWSRYKGAQALLRCKEFDEALGLCEIGLSDNATFLAEFASVLAHCYWNRGRHVNAKAWAEVATQVGPDKSRFGFQDPACLENAQVILRAYAKSFEPQEKRFTADTYSKREVFRDDYAIFGKAIAQAVGDEVRSVCDLGAGQGLLLDTLHGWLPGVEMWGCELEESAKEHASPFVCEVVDFGVSILDWKGSRAYLACCIEVAEHVPAVDSDTLVRDVSDYAESYLLFSAAHPGQGGHGHVNEQPKSYWLEKFRHYGWELDEARTAVLLDGLKELKTCTWLRDNCMILRR